MGFIKEALNSVGGTFSEQYLEYYVPATDITGTTVLFGGVMQGGSSNKGSSNIISNGSKIVVPEGTGLITVQDGAITGFIAEPGMYTWTTDSKFSQTLFGGEFMQIISQSWERFKFAGIPSAQQTFFYINLKEIPNNRFGTQSEIYWDDAFLNTQVGAILRGSYTLKITNPLLFVKNFVPSKYLTSGAKNFDLDDDENDASKQLFNEVVDSLGGALSRYVNNPDKGNRIFKIQSDHDGIADSLSQEVESSYQWSSLRGLQIVKVAITAIEYDEDSKNILKEAKKVDAMSGARGNTYLQMKAAEGIKAAGENGGGAGLAFMGMGMNAAGNMMSNLQQPVPQPAQPTQTPAQPVQQPQNPVQPTQPAQPVNQAVAAQPVQQSATAPAQPSQYDQLAEKKKMLDAGLISQADFDAFKNKLLGL